MIVLLHKAYFLCILYLYYGSVVWLIYGNAIAILHVVDLVIGLTPAPCYPASIFLLLAFNEERFCS